jgi:hypothetical protein
MLHHDLDFLRIPDTPGSGLKDRVKSTWDRNQERIRQLRARILLGSIERVLNRIARTLLKKRTMRKDVDEGLGWRPGRKFGILDSGDARGQHRYHTGSDLARCEIQSSSVSSKFSV